MAEQVIAKAKLDGSDAVWTAVGKEAGDSRIWAGIHYPMDNDAGVKLGRSVSQVLISWAENDGSH